MASNECNTTSDCLNVGSGVPRVCYGEVSFSDREFFCDCSNYYGWTGDRCDKPSTLTRYSLVSLTILTLWAVGLSLLSGRTLYFHFRYTSDKNRGLSPTFFTGSLVFIGSILFLIYGAANIPALINPKQFTLDTVRLVLSENVEDVTAKGGGLSLYCFILLGDVAVLVSAQIIISWYDVIALTSRFSRDIFRFSADQIKRVIKIWMAAFIVTSGALLIPGYMLGASAVLVFASFMTVFLYLYGGSHFVRALEDMRLERDTINAEALSIVIRSCKFNAALIMCEVPLVSLHAGLYVLVNESLKPGSFNPIIVARDLMAACVLAVLTFDSWFVHTITKNLLRLDEAKGWIPGVSARKIKKTQKSLERTQTSPRSSEVTAAVL